MSKRTYITLMNDFWEADARKSFSAPVTRVYFYLLNRINRNRWEPVFISDVELSEATGLSRIHLPDYREVLMGHGFIACSRSKEAGRRAGTVYSIPVRPAPKEADNCTQKGSLRSSNCTQKCNLFEETAPKSADSCTQKCSLGASTPINNIKTIRHTTTKDMRAGAREIVVDVADRVTKNGGETRKGKKTKKEENEEKRSDGAVERLIADKAKAAAQGAEVLKAAFHPFNQGTLEIHLKQSRLDEPTYHRLAEEVIADWTERGETHEDWRGCFDIKAATLHLQNAIRIKASAYHRQKAAPKSREQLRQEHIDAAYAGILQAINGELPQTPDCPDPF